MTDRRLGACALEAKHLREDRSAFDVEQIEELLQSDARIRFAAVIAVPDAAGDALPIAVVELFDGAVGDVAELESAYLAAGGDVRLGRVEVIAVMPMTPTGKLDKVALRLQFSA